LSTDEHARAEIHVGAAAVRLGSNTDFYFLELDNDTIQMRVTTGVISVSMRALEGRIEILTPGLTLTPLHPGSYRVEVNEAGDTCIVKVRDGEMQVKGPSQNIIVRAEQVVTFTGTNPVTAQLDTLGAADEFDSWTQDREARDYLASTSRSSHYVASDVTGYEDLDEYGTWSSEPEYGAVWTPSHVGTDWSPYSDGRWAWVSPWGWTWIDSAPWGYAPFHYGRWAHVSNRWCWVPGPRHARAVYAPALVGWGTRENYVSWFPLGPRDVYLPDGRYSRRYVERVNVTNAAIVHSVVQEVYENRARNVNYHNSVVPGAVTAVPRATFATAERVGGGPRMRLQTPANTGVTRQVIETSRSPAPVTPSTTSHPQRPDSQDLVRRVRERQDAVRVQREQTATQPAPTPQVQPRESTPQRAPQVSPPRANDGPRTQSSGSSGSSSGTSSRPATANPTRAVIEQVRAKQN
jgi:hypothetical protein